LKVADKGILVVFAVIPVKMGIHYSKGFLDSRRSLSPRRRRREWRFDCVFQQPVTGHLCWQPQWAALL